MSIFKDKLIVLNSKKLSDKNLIYSLFSYEYGKIQIVKSINRKEKNLDLGYIINGEIITKENKNLHKIKNIKIKSQFNTEKNNSFLKINLYLEILSSINKELAEGIANKEVFEIIEEINKLENINSIKLILAKLKIKSIFGNLKIEREDKKISKILKFIYFSKIKGIFRLTGIDKDLEEKLKNIS